MKRLTLGLISVVALSLLLVACGSADPEIIERTVVTIKEVPVEKIVEKQVVKEVEVERIVEKQVVKEVQVIATAMPLNPRLAVEQAKYGGDIRVTAQGSIASLDPGFAPAYVTYAIAFHLWEMPFNLDGDYNNQPQMIDTWSMSSDGLTWTFKIRDGLMFTDGKDVTADDLVASYGRWILDSGAGKFVASLMEDNGVTALDDKTFQFKMKQTMGGVPGAMGWTYRGLWVFPEDIASEAIGKREDIGEANYIGSGPYKLAQWDVGNRVVIERNEDYVPRNEPGTYLAGAKIAYVDKVTWLEIPDEETKIAGLKTAEWDVVDGAGLDFFAPLDADPTVNIAQYAFHKSFLGISHQEPPTGDIKIRQAIQISLDVEELMSGLGPSDLWFLCPAIYYCNTPLETDVGASEYYNQNDIPRAKQLLQEAGYSGETIFIMNPQDYATIAPLGPVLKAQLEAIGMKVEMPGMDWATLISRIYEKGWNIFTSWGTHNSFGHPLHDLNATEGGTGYGGGFTFPDMVDARINFALATDPKEQMRYVEELQMLYYTKIPRIYLGQFSSIYPHRSYVKNLTVPAYPLYFNVWLEK